MARQTDAGWFSGSVEVVGSPARTRARPPWDLGGNHGGTVAQHSKFWYLKNIDMFRGLSEKDIRSMEQGVVMRQARRREVFYLPGAAGDCVYVLKRGIVRISSLTGGRELTLALLRKGEVFGEEALLGGAPRDHTAEAYEDALVCIVPRDDFVALLRQRPDMFFEVTRRVGERQHTLRTRVERLLFKGAAARLAQTLLDLAQVHGAPDEDGVTLALRLSQTDLAKLIGVTRESVNTALSELGRRGLVAVDGGRLRLLDVNGLERVL